MTAKNEDIVNPTNRRLAAIDIGSNSIRLMIAEILIGGRFRVLHEERVTTRMAKRLSSTGLIDEEAVAATMQALANFKQLAESHEVTQLHTIATCALREAANGPELRQRIKDEIGLDVKVISAQQEGKYAFASVRMANDITERNVAVADIGGGSTEIVFAANGHIQSIVTTKLGVLRISGRYDFTSKSDFKKLQREIDHELESCCPIPPFHPEVLYGTGGTITNISSMLRTAKDHGEIPSRDYRVIRADIRHLLNRLQLLSADELRNMPGLNPDRAEIIVTGVAIVDRIMRHFGINSLQIHKGGVRNGLLASVAGGIQSGKTEDKEQAIHRFALSCGVDLAHARHVSKLASRLFDQLVAELHLDSNDRELLSAAAMLADVGYQVSYRQHQLHSFQLIFHSELPGLTEHQRELIALVARYHRGSHPRRKHSEFARLSVEDQRCVSQLAALLRIAEGLDHRHQQVVEDLAVSIKPHKIVISAMANQDIESELDDATQRGGLFQEVFGRKLTFRPK